MATARVPTIQNPDIFVQISNGFWQNGAHLSGFQDKEGYSSGMASLLALTILGVISNIHNGL